VGQKIKKQKYLTLWVCHSPINKRWFCFGITLNTLKLKLLAVNSWGQLSNYALQVAAQDGCLIEWAGFEFPTGDTNRLLYINKNY